MPRIKCSVTQCFYHQDDECRASSIFVRPKDPDYMITVAEDTACATFVPKHNATNTA
ncbi:MAG: DUF1540 domain-containing protein [Thermoanaerobacteraceae bacterium]|nr:DUF1540 domain-containing protein [Thermoanaerobacteraceae bacterium]